MGIISQAAKKIGVDRGTPYKWMKQDPEFKERVDEVINVPLDYVEGKLFEQISAGNITGIIFYLKTKGKKRGYVERQEITGVDNKDIQVQIEVLGSDK